MMSNNIFQGTSPNGNLTDAINEAVVNAKEALESDYIEWTMEKIKGKNGGFVLLNEITITIKADAGPK